MTAGQLLFPFTSWPSKHRGSNSVCFFFFFFTEETDGLVLSVGKGGFVLILILINWCDEGNGMDHSRLKLKKRGVLTFSPNRVENGRFHLFVESFETVICRL